MNECHQEDVLTQQEALAVLRLADALRERREEYAENITYSDLADLIGTSPEVVRRLVGKMRDEERRQPVMAPMSVAPIRIEVSDPPEKESSKDLLFPFMVFVAFVFFLIVLVFANQ